MFSLTVLLYIKFQLPASGKSVFSCSNIVNEIPISGKIVFFWSILASGRFCRPHVATRHCTGTVRTYYVVLFHFFTAFFLFPRFFVTFFSYFRCCYPLWKFKKFKNWHVQYLFMQLLNYGSFRILNWWDPGIAVSKYWLDVTLIWGRLVLNLITGFFQGSASCPEKNCSYEDGSSYPPCAAPSISIGFGNWPFGHIVRYSGSGRPRKSKWAGIL